MISFNKHLFAKKESPKHPKTNLGDIFYTYVYFRISKAL